jgi:acylphosphatase
MRRVHLRIRGRVQGVYFRQSAREQAERLDLRGWVRNLPDGDVEAVAEGPFDAVEAWVRWSHHGPPAARVDAVQVQDLAPEGAPPGFEVRR